MITLPNEQYEWATTIVHIIIIIIIIKIIIEET